jgi:hypothetical protein
MQSSGRLVFSLMLAWGVLMPSVGHAESSIADERFKTLDMNQDGVLSKFEYNSDAAVLMMDADRNGLVSASELQAFHGPENDEVASAAERIVGVDLNNDGELSADELRGSLELRFKWMDKNEDGNVDLDEYRAAFGVARVNLKGRVAH